MKSRLVPVGLVLALFAGVALADAGAAPSRKDRRAARAASAGTHAAREGGRLERSNKIRADGRKILSKRIREMRRAKRADRREALRRGSSSVSPSGSAVVYGATLLSESFTSGIPAGWTVLDNVGSGIEWSNLAGCGEAGNFTGGSGEGACVSSDIAFIGNYDTELRTPALDFSAVAAPANLAFVANYQNFSDDEGVTEGNGVPEIFEVDYSTNGASGPWTNLLHWEEDHGAFRGTPGETVNLDVAAVAGQSNVVFRFRYAHVPVEGFAWDWYVQIDDVLVTGTPTGCTLTCPSSVAVGNDPGACGATVNYAAPTTSGVCGAIVCTPASGGSFPVGTTSVTCQEQIPTLGAASCTFDVTVNDIEPPVISCPADQNATLPDGSTQVVVNYPAPTASDNCASPPFVSCTPPSGDLFPAGTTPVGCMASDNSTTPANCGFNVLVGGGQGSVLEIPTMSTKGLAGLALLLAAAAFVVLRRSH